VKPQLFNDHFSNYKLYNVPKAQLVLTDIPYNVCMPGLFEDVLPVGCDATEDGEVRFGD